LYGLNDPALASAGLLLIIDMLFGPLCYHGLYGGDQL
jgi:hypothetical protein